ncbi:hypothetical protein [Kitasatospora acidiphila]|nr:hypothetical protein [Kitasatospora acidiphila]
MFTDLQSAQVWWGRTCDGELGQLAAHHEFGPLRVPGKASLDQVPQW